MTSKRILPLDSNKWAHNSSFLGFFTLNSCPFIWERFEIRTTKDDPRGSVIKLCTTQTILFFPFFSFLITIMGAQVVDYRVSTLIVLCKDCGNDVGLYPARHKCTPVDKPVMPLLPLNYTENSSPSEASSSSVNRWLSRRGKTATEPITAENAEESVYFNNFAQNLPGANDGSSTTGKKLWGKVRQNEKWKQLAEKSNLFYTKHIL